MPLHIFVLDRCEDWRTFSSGYFKKQQQQQKQTKQTKQQQHIKDYYKPLTIYFVSLNTVLKN